MIKYTVKGDALEKYVQENNLTAYEFCKKFGIGLTTYDKIICGKRVQLTTLFVLARKMGLSMYDFLDEKPPKNVKAI